jgi:hypothetical protein
MPPRERKTQGRGGSITAGKACQTPMVVVRLKADVWFQRFGAKQKSRSVPYHPSYLQYVPRLLLYDHTPTSHISYRIIPNGFPWLAQMADTSEFYTVMMHTCL